MKPIIFLAACLFSTIAFAKLGKALLLKTDEIAFVRTLEDPLQEGIIWFTKGEYTKAVNAFKKAQEQTPFKQAVYLWLGIAYVATDDKNMAYNTWLRMPVQTDAMVMTMYLKGLTEWKYGKIADAKYWFGNTASYPKTSGHNLAKQALAKMQKGEPVPPVANWPALVSLTSLKDGKVGAEPTPASKEEKKSAVNIPASLPLGTYQCFDIYAEMSQSSRTTYKEKLIIRDKTTYEYKSGKSTMGKYKYDTASGKITFISGPYAGSSLSARFSYRTGDNKPLITLTYSFKNLGTDEDFCVFVAQ